MRASELREKLFALQREHGDLEVLNDENDEIDVEFSEDDPPAFVVM